MLKASIRHIAREAARRHDLPAAIVLAIVQVESAGNPWAHRIEPGYRWLWDVRRNRAFRPGRANAQSITAPGQFPGGTFANSDDGDPVRISADSEWIAQKTSWGLMQLMGANARSYGFDLPLPALCEPNHGLEYGCRHLAAVRDRYISHGWASVVDAWNDGSWVIESSRDYPDLVAAVSPEAAELLERSA